MRGLLEIWVEEVSKEARENQEDGMAEQKAETAEINTIVPTML